MPGFDYSHSPVSAGLVRLYESGYLVSGAASIDTGANAIAAGHADLLVYIYVRTNRAAVADNLLITFNGDSAAHYDSQRLQGITTTASASSSTASTALSGGITIPSATGTANVFSPVRIDIPAYDQTIGWKPALVFTTDPDSTSFACTLFGCQWRSTAAINQIAVAPSVGTQLVAGSRMVVYGCQ